MMRLLARYFGEQILARDGFELGSIGIGNAVPSLGIAFVMIVQRVQHVVFIMPGEKAEGCANIGSTESR